MMSALATVVDTPVLGAVVAQNIFFYLIAVVMVISALRVVTTSNIVHAALYLVVVLAGVAAQFLLLGAEFVGVTQVLVYIGAVIVLFLFGIMLTRAKVGAEDGLNHDNLAPSILTAVLLVLVMGYAVVDFSGSSGGTAISGAVFATPVSVAEELGLNEDELKQVVVVDFVDKSTFEKDVFVRRAPAVQLPGIPVAAAPVTLRGDDVVVELLTDANGSYSFENLVEGQYVVQHGDEARNVKLGGQREIDVLGNKQTTVEKVSDSIFSTYIVAFEAISVLLLAALIGAIVVARKE